MLCYSSETDNNAVKRPTENKNKFATYKNWIMIFFKCTTKSNKSNQITIISGKK